MAAPHEKLAASLAVLQKLQRDRRVFRSNEFSRVHRERLVKNGFLREVAKGWLISTSPGTQKGDSTPWFASFWEFCARYCTDRFGESWHLSPEQSLLLHAENTIIPAQVVVYSPKGANNTIKLLFGTSVYDLKQRMPAKTDLVSREGLRIPHQLPRSSASLNLSSPGPRWRHSRAFARQRCFGSTSPASRRGAFGRGGPPCGRLPPRRPRQRCRRDCLHDEIGRVRIRENDPFAPQQTFTALETAAPPIVGRLHALWEAARGTVIKAFPKAPGLPTKPADYLSFVDDIYTSDAYHSLPSKGTASHRNSSSVSVRAPETPNRTWRTPRARMRLQRVDTGRRSCW